MICCHAQAAFWNWHPLQKIDEACNFADFMRFHDWNKLYILMWIWDCAKKKNEYNVDTAQMLEERIRSNWMTQLL